MTEQIVTRVPGQVVDMWQQTLMSLQDGTVEQRQERLRFCIRQYMINKWPGHKVTWFEEFGRDECRSLELATGKRVEPGFYIRHRALTEEEMWALEPYNFAEQLKLEDGPRRLNY